MTGRFLWNDLTVDDTVAEKEDKSASIPWLPLLSRVQPHPVIVLSTYE